MSNCALFVNLKAIWVSSIQLTDDGGETTGPGECVQLNIVTDSLRAGMILVLWLSLIGCDLYEPLQPIVDAGSFDAAPEPDDAGQDSDADTDSDSDIDSDSDTESDSGTDSDSETDSGSDTGVDTDTELPPDAIVLTGTIRDFSHQHPDFERPFSDSQMGRDNGIVVRELGSDRKPVHAGQDSWSTTTKANFDQWYNDSPGINIGMNHSIVLLPEGDHHVYRNEAFFPIDNKLFGNETLAHNFHFTFEIHTSFTYEGGEVFYFRGDDDLFLFLNGYLVMDLGGVHKPLSAEIAVDAIAAEIGIEPDQEVTFELFFAERHTDLSGFSIVTNMKLKPS